MRMPRKMSRKGDLRRMSDLGYTGKSEFWFGRKILQTIDLIPIVYEFWFGTLANYLEMLGR